MANKILKIIMAVILVHSVTLAGMVFSAPVVDCSCCCCTQDAGHGHIPIGACEAPEPSKCAQCVQGSAPAPSPNADMPSRSRIPRHTDFSVAVWCPENMLILPDYPMAWQNRYRAMDLPFVPLYLQKSSMLC